MDDDEEERTVNVGKHAAVIRGLRVLVVSEGKAVTHWLPPAGDVTIGRFTGSKVVINHDTLSRMHAILRVTADAMTIEDLGSENGTFVREARIKPGEPVPFSTGDVVRLGDVILIFRI